MASSIFLWPGAMTFGGNVTVTGVLAANSIALDAANQDVLLVRDAANILAQRNGANAQTFNLYRTFTDTGNYERLAFVSGTTNEIRSENNGTGTYRALQLTGITVALATGASGGAATAKWRCDTTGHWIAVTDNTLDIGATAATRPRTGYFATSVVAPTYQTTVALIATGGGAGLPAFVANSTGGAGQPTTANQNGWLKATDSTGATIWIPVWK